MNRKVGSVNPATELTEEDAALSVAITLLEFRCEMLNRPFTEVLERGYTASLRPFAAPSLVTAIQQLLEEETFLPDDGKIKRRVAEIESPRPTREAAFVEAMDQAGRVCSRPFSHPLLARTVEEMGGLNEGLWHPYQFLGTPLSVLRKQFYEAYDRASAAWTIEVVGAIRQGLRPRALFPGYEAKKFHPDAIPELARRRPESGGRARRRTLLRESNTPASEEIMRLVREARQNLQESSAGASAGNGRLTHALQI